MKVHVFLSVKPDFLSQVAGNLKNYLSTEIIVFSVSASLPHFLKVAHNNLSPIYSEIDFYSISLDSRKKTIIDFDWLDKMLQGYTIWEIIASDSRHNKNWNYDDLVQYCFLVLRKIQQEFASNKPELLIMDDKSCIPSYALWLVAKKMNIPTVVISSARTDGRVWFSNDEFENSREFESYLQKLYANEIAVDNLPEVKRYLQNIKSYTSQTYKGKNIPSSFVQLLISKIKKYLSLMYFNFKFPKNRVTYNNFVKHLSIKVLIQIKRFFQSKFFNKRLPVEDFILFTLHVQPEASTDVLAPYYVNQIALVQQIALTLPVKMRLVVKEHIPAFGTRKTNFYKNLIDIPNVWLLDRKFSNTELLTRSQAVVTISGTVAWEAWCSGKPVALFGNTRFDNLTGVRKLTSINDLKLWIQELVNNRIILQGERDIYFTISALLKSTTKGYIDHSIDDLRVLEQSNIESISKGVMDRYLWIKHNVA
jgi:Capsule polysaccharide biosynthesis protein